MNFRALLGVFAIAAAAAVACSAPRAAWRTDADPQETADWVRDHWTDPDQAAEARRQQAWLCLLWGRDCPLAAQTAQGGETPVDQTEMLELEAALVGGWLGDAAAGDAAAAGHPAMVNRAAAGWLRAAKALQPFGVEGDRAATVALRRALQRAALSDRPAVVDPALTQRGAADQRVARALALAAADSPQSGSRLPAQLRAAQQIEPWSRRIVTGLDRATAAPFAAQPPEFAAGGALELPLEGTESGAARLALAVGRPGVAQVQLRWHGGGRALLGLGAERPLLAWLDGRRLGAGPEKTLAAPVELSGGPHVLDVLVAAAADGDPLGVVWLSADAPATAPANPAQRPAAADVPPELQVVLDQTAALLAEPMAATLQWWQQHFPKAILPALRGLFAGAAAQEGEAVDQVRAVWPEHAAALLLDAHRHLDAGNPQAALEQLDLLRPRKLRGEGPGQVGLSISELPSMQARLARIQALQQLGLGDLALAELRRERPHRCDQRGAVWQVALDAGHRSALRQLAADARADDCPELWLSAARLWQAADQQARAGAALQQALLRPASARQAQLRLEQNAALHGWPAPAQAQWHSDPGQAAWLRAQKAWLARDSAAADEALAALVGAKGPSLSQRQQALRAGAPAPWTRWQRDGAALAAEADDPSWASGARLAWLLDQEVVVLLPGGGAIRRVHQVLRVLTDEAAEAVGEVRVAQGADLEMARTLLADGSALAPADTADKETISLRGVEAGTAVEYAQVAYVEPEDEATGATRMDPFLFQAFDGPVRLSELVVLVPAGVTVTLDASARAPAAQVQQVGDFTVYTYRATQIPQARQEPRAARPETSLASVRLSAQASLSSLVEPWQEALQAGVRAAALPLQSWRDSLIRIPAGELRWRELALRVAQQVQQQHDGGLPGSAARALEQRQGDRAAVFYAAAVALGADACLVRVRPLAREPEALAADPLDWPMELVELPGPGGSQWFDPGLEGGLLNHVRAGLRGRTGLRIGCALAAEQRRVQVPALGEGQDTRMITGDIHWEADGSVRAEIAETLGGAMAALVRQLLMAAGPAERDTLIADLAGSAFPGLKLHSLAIDGLQASGPLVVRYVASGPASPQRLNTLDLGLMPAELGKGYAGLPQRSTALLLGYASELQVQWRIHSPGRPIQPVATLKAQHPLVQLLRRAAPLNAKATAPAWQPSESLQLDYQLHVTPGVVAPGDYPALAETLRQVDLAEQLRLSR